MDDRKPASSDGTQAERVCSGHGVSSGIAIGPAYVRESGNITVPEYGIPRSRVEEETARFDKAVELAIRQVNRLQDRARALPKSAAEELGYLLDAYEHMLRESRLIRGVRRRVGQDRINAEAAVQAELTEISHAFKGMQDSYISARLDDIREVAMRIVRNLTKTPHTWLSTLPRGAIVFAEEITPADTARMDPKTISGFASMLGGAEGHTAIMARALGLPAVVGVTQLVRDVRAGDMVIVDGDLGKVFIRPTPETLEEYRLRRAEDLAEKRRLARMVRTKAVTLDGEPVDLQANVELPIEMDMVRRMGAAGIGLLRTEFLFMNRDDVPSEDEQYEILRDMIGKLDGKPLSVRTLDVGGEKLAASLGESSYSLGSVLGLRGIRLSLEQTDLLATQFAAILRAAAHGPVRIILPMVSRASEIRRARAILRQVWDQLSDQKVPLPDSLPPLGPMIEVPGAALAADALAQVSDFFSIGSNDLTMYTIAIDRADERVAGLYDPLHPAVLRLLQFAAMAALRARIPLSICGEIAGDPRYTALLLGLGIHSLSMSPLSIPKVKRRVREIDLAAARTRANIITSTVDSGRIAALVDDFNGANS